MTRTRIRARGLVGPIVAAAVLVGCGTTSAQPGAGAAGGVSAGPAPATASQRAASSTASVPGAGARAAARTAARGAPSVGVRTARGYRSYLVDGRGRTLYLFTADRPGGSACGGACAVAWPPLIVHGAPAAGAGIVTRRLSVIRRAGGQRQLAYYGHPLYYYVGDRQPGQILCQDAEEYGGHWWLVQPNGQINRSHP